MFTCMLLKHTGVCEHLRALGLSLEATVHSTKGPRTSSQIYVGVVLQAKY